MVGVFLRSILIVILRILWNVIAVKENLVLLPLQETREAEPKMLVVNRQAMHCSLYKYKRLFDGLVCIREDTHRKNVFFRALPESPNPHPPPICATWSSFSNVKNYVLRIWLKKISDNDNVGCNDNYDDNDGHFDDNDDKNY